MAQRVGQGATAFLVSALIARALGPEALGRFAIAFSFYWIAVTVCSTGFKTLFTREIARDGGGGGDHLVSGTALQVVAAVLGYAALLGVVHALPYDAETTRACVLLGLCVVPFALSNVAEAVLQAREKMHLIALATVPVYAVRLAAVWWSLRAGYGLEAVCIVLVATDALIWLLEWPIAARCAPPVWRLSLRWMRERVRASRRLVVIEGLAVLNARMHLVVLSLIAGHTVTGLYGAAMQLLQPYQIAAQSLMMAIFPGLVRTARHEPGEQRRLVESAMGLLLLVSLPMIFLFVWRGADVLRLAYEDPDFVAAGPALVVMSAGLVTAALSRALSYVLVATGNERVNMREVIVAGLVGLPLTAVLSWRYGLVGAAAAVPVLSVLAFVQYASAVHRRLFRVRFGEVLLRPVAVGLAVAAAFAVAHLVRAGFWPTCAAAGAAWGFAALLVYLPGIGAPLAATAKRPPTRAAPVGATPLAD